MNEGFFFCVNKKYDIFFYFNFLFREIIIL